MVRQVKTRYSITLLKKYRREVKKNMKEMIQIENYVAKVHKKFMSVKTTTEDHFTRDLWFSMNIMTMAFNNLERWSKTTQNPNKAFKDMIKAQLKKCKIKL